MKKTLFVLSIVSLLYGCSNEDAADQPAEEVSNNAEVIEEETPIEVEASVTDKISYTYTSPFTDQNMLSAFAVIENKSDVPIDLTGAVSIDYFAPDGSVIGKSDMGTDPIPSILEPGESGYVEVYEMPGENVEVGEITVNTSPVEAFTEVPDKLATGDVQIKLDTTSFQTPVFNVTGNLINDTDVEIAGASITGAMYDSNGKFLGVLQNGIDDTIAPGQSVAFELFDPKVSVETMQQVSEVKVIAVSSNNEF